MGNPLGISEIGEYACLAHLHSLRITCGLFYDEHSDCIARIGREYRTFQVKTTTDGYTFPSGGFHNGNIGGAHKKTFREYNVDAFVFVRAIDFSSLYYEAIESIRGRSEDTITFSPNTFSKFSRDVSFRDLLVRWGVESRQILPVIPDLNGNGYMQLSMFGQ